MACGGAERWPRAHVPTSGPSMMSMMRNVRCGPCCDTARPSDECDRHASNPAWDRRSVRSASQAALRRRPSEEVNREPTAAQRCAQTAMPTSPSVEMAADPGHRDSRGDPPISDIAAGQIAATFKLPLADVILDAGQVSAWGHSNDDLLVWLEHRHIWSARGALAYLISLRSALQHDSNRGSSG